MIDLDVDIFVCHLKGVVDSARGFDFACLEDKSEREAMEMLEKHFGPEVMDRARLARGLRGGGPRWGTPQTAEEHKPSSSMQAHDAVQEHQPVEGIGKTV